MHYLTACLIFKDAAPYLDEWIRFHLLVGFDHLYLYDNESIDDAAAVVRPYLARKQVTLHAWPGQGQQTPVFRECLQRHGHEARWMAFIDDDEFLFPAEGSNLRQVLPSYEQHAGVAACWLLFGSSGHRTQPAGLVTENYRRRAANADKHVKCFVDPSRVSGPAIGGHAFHCTSGQIVDENHCPTVGPFSAAPSAKIICLNHYLTKSEEEMLHRRTRITVDGLPQEHSLETWRLWDPYYNEAEDLRVQRFVQELGAPQETAA